MMGSRYFILGLVLAGAIFIFAVDTVTDVNISVSMLYVILVIIVLRTGVIRNIVAAGVGCGFLTILSYLLSPGAGIWQKTVAINCGLSLFAIASTTSLGIRLVRMEGSARKARDQLARAARGVTVTELTASIAHEINQPLAATVANAGAAKRWLDAAPPNFAEARSAIDAAGRNAARAGEVVNGLRRLISTSSPVTTRVDVAGVIAEIIDTMRLELSEHHVNVVTRFPDDLPTIVGDRVLIQQAILNLLSNAFDAMENVAMHDRRIEVGADLADGKVVVGVRDTGVGVAPELLDRLFDPFYTTKTSGMGIGLAISRSIAEAHGGSVRASRNPHRGMLFELILPAAVPGDTKI